MTAPKRSPRKASLRVRSERGLSYIFCNLCESRESSARNRITHRQRERFRRAGHQPAPRSSVSGNACVKAPRTLPTFLLRRFRQARVYVNYDRSIKKGARSDAFRHNAGNLKAPLRSSVIALRFSQLSTADLTILFCKLSKRLQREMTTIP